MDAESAVRQPKAPAAHGHDMSGEDGILLAPPTCDGGVPTDWSDTAVVLSITSSAVERLDVAAGLVLAV